MHTKIFSATTMGVSARLVEVEVDLSLGLLTFNIVGLPDTAVKESRQRVQTALKNCRIRLPEKKITVNLAPADLKKEGTVFDLSIAIGILQAARHVSLSSTFINETVFLGELSLDGSIRPVKGVLAVAYDAQKLGVKRVVVPHDNAHEAALIEGLEVIGTSHLVELVSHLHGSQMIHPTTTAGAHALSRTPGHGLDFAHVKGQEQAKRALQISAAGKHNILFIGSPGAGKTMLAKRLPSIMPDMTFGEVLEASKVYSICGKLHNKPLITRRPFRNPHHTISQAGLVGGGTLPRPGEISLAHHGILFLDELTEFKKDTLEVLRQPLENKEVSIARVQQAVTFPASFLLIAALNPCPCGYYGDERKECTCSSASIERYMNKISGPLLDRIDLQINVRSVDYQTIKQANNHTHSSAELKRTVEVATKIQRARFGTAQITNATMPAQDIERHCTLTADAEAIIKKAFDRLGLSMRGYHKTLKVARTIADLDEQQEIGSQHITEALMYRSLDHAHNQRPL